MKFNFYSKKGSLKLCLWKICNHQEKQKPLWAGNEILLYCQTWISQPHHLSMTKGYFILIPSDQNTWWHRIQHNKHFFQEQHCCIIFFSDNMNSKQQQAKDLSIFTSGLLLKLALCNCNKDYNFPDATCIRSLLKQYKHWRKFSNSEKFILFFLL